MGNPFVSVVVMTMGDADLVKKGLIDQTYRNFEVIFAREKGCVNALNRALARARGDIFVRLDDDVELPRRWLENLISPFEDDPSVAGCTGPTFVPKELRVNRDSIRWAESPHWFLKWLYDNGEVNPGGIRKCGCVSYDSNYEERLLFFDNEFECDHLEGTNWAMRTELIRKVGGFDPKFDGVSEWVDTDVEQKIKKLGYILLYNPKAYLWHMIQPASPHFSERFDGIGRLKNWLRYHLRHSRFHPKMVLYFMLWSFYFLTLKFRNK